MISCWMREREREKERERERERERESRVYLALKRKTVEVGKLRLVLLTCSFEKFTFNFDMQF